jgi:hypothetical protein
MKPTIYEAAGGHQAFIALARAWHAQCPADPIVSHAFSHGDHPQHLQTVISRFESADSRVREKLLGGRMSGPWRSLFHTILHAMCVTVGAVLFCAGLPTLGLAQPPPQSCARHNGTWLEQYQECEYASKEWCDTEGGQFDECATACRHDPNPARPCTMQCVPVCKFPVAPVGKDPEDSVRH